MNISKKVTSDEWQVTRKSRTANPVTCHLSRGTSRGFTMVEVALSLAIIGIALVAIIGVLPIGMRTQRDNREETIINQDATVLMEAIRNGQRGLNELTNYIYAISNYWTLYNSDGSQNHTGVNGYTISAGFAYGASVPAMALTNGANIVGLLTTPEYTSDPTNGLPLPTLFNQNGYSNHVVAYVRSLSGPAVEKPPQDNDIIVGDSFSYRLLCVNAPVATDTNFYSGVLYPDPTSRPAYVRQLVSGLHDLRLMFLWPQLPNGKVGAGRQSFRTLVAGQISQVLTNGQWLYFYQPQSFTNVVSTP